MQHKAAGACLKLSSGGLHNSFHAPRDVYDIPSLLTTEQHQAGYVSLHLFSFFYVWVCSSKPDGREKNKMQYAITVDEAIYISQCLYTCRASSKSEKSKGNDILRTDGEIKSKIDFDMFIKRWCKVEIEVTPTLLRPIRILRTGIVNVASAGGGLSNCIHWIKYRVIQTISLQYNTNSSVPFFGFWCVLDRKAYLKSTW